MSDVEIIEAERYELFVPAEKMDLDIARTPLTEDILREANVHGR
ncbi:hypothetical protein [Paramagnetospirillum magneticum]|nr:hypothetical protein [Paramagnetospirillum magneticum]